ncbi:hypothetical protein GCM10027199_84710 [Amycolatopsis magusensis]
MKRCSSFSPSVITATPAAPETRPCHTAFFIMPVGYPASGRLCPGTVAPAPRAHLPWQSGPEGNVLLRLIKTTEGHRTPTAAPMHNTAWRSPPPAPRLGGGDRRRWTRTNPRPGVRKSAAADHE